jgi:hypothetical protein
VLEIMRTDDTRSRCIAPVVCDEADVLAPALAPALLPPGLPLVLPPPLVEPLPDAPPAPALAIVAVTSTWCPTCWLRSLLPSSRYDVPVRPDPPVAVVLPLAVAPDVSLPWREVPPPAPEPD